MSSGSTSHVLSRAQSPSAYSFDSPRRPQIRPYSTEHVSNNEAKCSESGDDDDDDTVSTRDRISAELSRYISSEVQHPASVGNMKRLSETQDGGQASASTQSFSKRPGTASSVRSKTGSSMSSHHRTLSSKGTVFGTVCDSDATCASLLSDDEWLVTGKLRDVLKLSGGVRSGRSRPASARKSIHSKDSFPICESSRTTALNSIDVSHSSTMQAAIGTTGNRVPRSSQSLGPTFLTDQMSQLPPTNSTTRSPVDSCGPQAASAPVALHPVIVPEALQQTQTHGVPEDKCSPTPISIVLQNSDDRIHERRESAEHGDRSVGLCATAPAISTATAAALRLPRFLESYGPQLKSAVAQSLAMEQVHLSDQQLDPPQDVQRAASASIDARDAVQQFEAQLPPFQHDAGVMLRLLDENRALVDGGYLNLNGTISSSNSTLLHSGSMPFLRFHALVIMTSIICCLSVQRCGSEKCI